MGEGLSATKISFQENFNKIIVRGNWGHSQKQMNNKTQQVSETFCFNCHNYKEKIDKLLK